MLIKQAWIATRWWRLMISSTNNAQTHCFHRYFADLTRFCKWEDQTDTKKKGLIRPLGRESTKKQDQTIKKNRKIISPHGPIVFKNLINISDKVTKGRATLQKSMRMLERLLYRDFQSSNREIACEPPYETLTIFKMFLHLNFWKNKNSCTPWRAIEVTIGQIEMKWETRGRFAAKWTRKQKGWDDSGEHWSSPLSTLFPCLISEKTCRTRSLRSLVKVPSTTSRGNTHRLRHFMRLDEIKR